ncbi:protein FAM133-like [Iris pallida]|uniref:Protein FAM133-like n=1 Tax=Iris pallida TaxID=29817 RepID=A0AAX6GC71_IRIPA|nr:protein FAM133-like [Iris pallida]
MGKKKKKQTMQRSNVGSSSAGPEDVDQGKPQMDGSFRSPELHAAHLASLKTSHTITQEEFKKKHKEDELKTGEQEADEDRMMIENRAQLDAERARKLSLGRNRSTSKSHQENESKDEDSKIGSRRKRKVWSQTVQEETGDSQSPQPVESNMEETGDSQSSQPVESSNTWVQGGKDDSMDDTGSLASQPSLCSVAPPCVAPDPRLVEMMSTLKSLQQQLKQLQEMAKKVSCSSCCCSSTSTCSCYPFGHSSCHPGGYVSDDICAVLGLFT